MQFVAFGASIPWKEVIQATAKLSGESRKWYESIKVRRQSKQRKDTVDKPEVRIAQLEADIEEQSTIIASLAQQNEALGRGLEELDHQIRQLEERTGDQSLMVRRVGYAAAIAVIASVAAIALTQLSGL